MSNKGYDLNKNLLKNHLARFFLVFFGVLFATFVAWFTNGKSLIGIDDANIYMVYMRNFANGHGFVYNIGGERVEGFTSLLWTVVGASFFSVSNHPEILLLISNIIIVSYCLWKLASYLDRYFNDNRLATPFSLLFIGSLVLIPGYFEWTVLSLMETGLWSCLLILTTLCLLENNKNNHRFVDIKFCMLITLLVFCRPESMLWCLFFVAAKFFKVFQNTKSIKQGLLSIVLPLIVFIISLVGLITWREYYFGFPLPNTFYAKVSSNLVTNFFAGIKYNVSSFHVNPLVLLSLLLVAGNIYAVSKLKQKSNQYALFLTGGVAFLTLAIPLYSGGDHFELSRFIQPTTPLILIALLLNLNLLKVKVNYYFSVVFLVVFSFANAQSIYMNLKNQRSLITHEWGTAKKDRYRSKKLNTFFEKNFQYPSQGVIAAGGSAFAYKGFTNDLLGLNNVEMAHASSIKNQGATKNHASFNKDVFYRQLPDILWISGGFFENTAIDKNRVTINNFTASIVQDIYKDSKFREKYSLVVIRNKELSYSLVVFSSNNFLNSLNDNIYKYKMIEFEG